MLRLRTIGLTFSFLIFVLLSWILLFRDERALTGIAFFYPFLNTSLQSTRQLLLHAGLNSIMTGLFALTAIGAFIFYVASFRDRISTKHTIIAAVIFQLMVFFSYPILSTDIFSYVMTARVESVYHQNVWLVPPITFNNDTFLLLSDWKTSTNVYGGVSEILYIAGSTFAGNNLFANIVIYKWIALVFSLLSMVVMYLIFRDKEELLRAFALRFVFWNPLYILEIAGAGHNDSIVLFFLLLAYYLYTKKRWMLSGIVFALGVQVKIVPIFLLFYFCLELLRKKQYSKLLQILVPFALTVAVVLYFMHIDPVFYATRILLNTSIYWQSLSGLLSRFHFDIRTLFTGVFALLTLGIGAWQWKRKTDPVISFVVCLSIYLLFLTSAYWNWYVLWVFVLLPMVGNSKLKLFGLLFTFTSLLAYPLYWLSLRFDYQNIWWAVIIYAAVFLVPLGSLMLFRFRRINSLRLP